VVYDTYDADETLEAKMMAGDSGYDVVSTSTDFFSRQIKAGIYQKLDRSKLPNWKNLDPHVLAIEAGADPGNQYAMPYLRHVNGFAYNVDMIKSRMPDAPLDSLDMIFKPQIIARFADCGVTFLDQAEDVLQLALNYLHLDPNSTNPRGLQARREAAARGASLHPRVRLHRVHEWPRQPGVLYLDVLVRGLCGGLGRAPRPPASMSTWPSPCRRRAPTPRSMRC
jgi:spermidine/putrescine-binding protein